MIIKEEEKTKNNEEDILNTELTQASRHNRFTERIKSQKEKQLLE
ncbi:hypothetical protein [Clostridium gasigenes]|nr:hypothetical protein [Clostridium gasigenes]